MRTSGLAPRGHGLVMTLENPGTLVGPDLALARLLD